MIKVNGPPDTVRTMVRWGIAVFAEFHGGGQADAELVARAKALEQAGAAGVGLPPFRAPGRPPRGKGGLLPGVRRPRRRPRGPTRPSPAAPPRGACARPAPPPPP